MSENQSFGVGVSTAPAFSPPTDKPLNGRYVTLEYLSVDHIPSLFKNLGFPDDKSVLDWLPWAVPNTENEFWDILDELRTKRGFVIYAIKADPSQVNRYTGNASSDFSCNERTEILGTIGYLDIKLQNRTLETGAVLFGSALRRTVAATEAHYLLLCNVLDRNASSDSPSYRRVAWKCNSLNTQSLRAAERIGYTYEGTWRNHMISNGKSRDTDWLSITDDDWPLVKAALERWLEKANFDEHGRQIKPLNAIREGLVEAQH